MTEIQTWRADRVIDTIIGNNPNVKPAQINQVKDYCKAQPAEIVIDNLMFEVYKVYSKKDRELYTYYLEMVRGIDTDLYKSINAMEEKIHQFSNEKRRASNNIFKIAKPASTKKGVAYQKKIA